MLKTSRRQPLTACARRSPVAPDDQGVDQVRRRLDHLLAWRTGEKALLNRLTLFSQHLRRRHWSGLVEHARISFQWCGHARARFPPSRRCEF